MNVARAEFTALLTKDSNVIVLGGVRGYVHTSGGSGTLTAMVERYDRLHNQWYFVGNLRVARRQHTAIWLNEWQILVVGGRHEDLSTMAAAEVFDVTTGQSQLVNAYPYSMTDLVSAQTSTGHVVVWGGCTGGPNSFRTNEIFEFTGSGWSLFQRLPEVSKSPSVLSVGQASPVLWWFIC